MNGQPEASDSSGSMRRSWVMPAGVVQRHLAAAAHDDRHRAALFGVLGVGKVYVADVDVVLGIDGPYLAFCPRQTILGAALEVFTSRTRLPAGRLAHTAESMPFVYLLNLLEPGTRLLIDPSHEGLMIEADEVEALQSAIVPWQH